MHLASLILNGTIQFKMMQTAPEIEKRRRLEEKLRRELGSPIVTLLDSQSAVEDILLNADGRLWVKQTGSHYEPFGTMMPTQARSLLSTIASMRGTEVSRISPILEAELPIWGARFEGLVEPVVREPVFAIRQRAVRIFTLEDYERQGILQPSSVGQPETEKREDFLASIRGLSHRQVLEAAILLRKNILVVGATGSGKTTFLNAILHEVATATPDDRLVVIEDTPELQVQSQNSVSLLAMGPVTMLDCLRATLRLRPTRIVVGEVRGREALTLLKAWNTGHPGGVASIHANDAAAGLIRLEALIAEEGSAPQPRLIAEAVDLVVSISADAAEGRRVREVSIVLGYREGRYDLARV
jgi:type IV secretion system protein TrbB